jgi:hypothetical protein
MLLIFSQTIHSAIQYNHSYFVHYGQFPIRVRCMSNQFTQFYKVAEHTVQTASDTTTALDSLVSRSIL